MFGVVHIMINFEIWIQIGIFHFTLTPKSIALIRIKNGIFYYLIDWHKPEPKPKKKTQC
jgi:hypothetical protein